MNRETDNDDVSRQTGAWLDGDGKTPPPDLPAGAQPRIADLQMVDALLANLSRDERDEQASRIQRVMAAIESGDPSARSIQRYSTFKSAMAIAASLLVALGLFWSRLSSESRASVVLREIREVTLENVDRVYHLRRRSSSTNVEREVDAKLYLRGRDGFVLRCGDVALGRSGDEFWLVPKQGDVLVATSFHWMVANSRQSTAELELLKQLSADSRRVPIMQLSAVVQLMKDDYYVTLGPPTPQVPAEHIIVGTLQNDATNLPNKISLWADATSNIIRRAEFRWGTSNTLSLELAPAEQVPVNWYAHESHHDNKRVTRRVPR